MDAVGPHVCAVELGWRTARSGERPWGQLGWVDGRIDDPPPGPDDVGPVQEAVTRVDSYAGRDLVAPTQRRTPPHRPRIDFGPKPNICGGQSRATNFLRWSPQARQARRPPSVACWDFLAPRSFSGTPPSTTGGAPVGERGPASGSMTDEHPE